MNQALKATYADFLDFTKTMLSVSKFDPDADIFDCGAVYGGDNTRRRILYKSERYVVTDRQLELLRRRKTPEQIGLEPQENF